MPDFVSEANIDLFLGRLSDGCDPHQEALLLKLLVEEESRVGRKSENLDKAERRVANGKDAIARQRALIASATLDEHSLDNAQALLRTLEGAQKLLELHWRRVHDDLALGRL